MDRKTDDALWKRYSAARETFNRRRGSHFAELDRERAGAKQAKERLCERAEELSGSTDWAGTAAAFRDLLAEWKAAGRAAKDVDDALWHRFKAAQDTFFTARNAVSAERDAEFTANAAAKEALLAEAEKIDTANARRGPRQPCGRSPTNGTRSARCPASGRPIWSGGCARWRRRCATPPMPSRVDPQARARAEQFQARVEQFERQAEKAEAAGRTKEAAEARANAEQWRQWAEAATQSLGRRG